MTREQLDEIEELAEAATPDPWCVAIRGDAVTIETTGIECFVVAEMPRSGATDVQDATFIRAMREHALPLVKSLREAQAALEWQAAMTKALLESQEMLMQEVKEARVEAQTMRALLISRHGGEMLTLMQELDAAKEEIIRLRRHLGEIP